MLILITLIVFSLVLIKHSEIVIEFIKTWFGIILLLIMFNIFFHK